MATPAENMPGDRSRMPAGERLQALVGACARRSRARLARALASDTVPRFGRVMRSAGDVMHVSGLPAPIGARCLVESEDSGWLPAEVVGFDRDALLLMPERGRHGITRGARVRTQEVVQTPAVGEALLGRILDGNGEPLDGRVRPRLDERWPLAGRRLNPLERARIAQPFDVGVRIINAMATLGRGMRVGLFAGSGVGKSTLLGMMARHAQADVVVAALIGERGREVREFIEDNIGDSLDRAVVIASPADATALARLHGAYRAAAIAEYFRATGRHVLLLVDSLTRLAMAAREVGLAAGEPPVTRGYPPSVFGLLSSYVERAGNGPAGQGSITGVYTVLVEGDDHVADPVADTARAVLDGHLVLSRKLTESALYPPIDIEASLSRIMPAVTDRSHQRAAAHMRALWAKRAEKQDLIDIGAYSRGADPLLDEAMLRADAMESLIRQAPDESVSLTESIHALQAAMAPLATQPTKEDTGAS